MSCRRKTLSSNSADGPKAEHPLAAVPLFDEIWPSALLAVFKQSLERTGGILLEPPATGDALQPIRDMIDRAKVVCSMVSEIAGNRGIADFNSPAELEDVQFVIAHALYAVAETGSVFLSEGSLRINAIAHLARHVVVLLDPADIVVNLRHAYGRAQRRLADPALFRSGASVAPRIEGVLLDTTRDVRSLSVLPIAKHTYAAPSYSRTPLKFESAARV